MVVILKTIKGVYSTCIKSKPVVDTTGAGDAFNGALSVAISQDKNYKAIEFGKSWQVCLLQGREQQIQCHTRRNYFKNTIYFRQKSLSKNAL